MSTDRATLRFHPLKVLLGNVIEPRFNLAGIIFTELANKECSIGMRLDRKQSRAVLIDSLIHT